MVKNVPAMQKTRVASLVVKIPWRRATRSRIPAWRILMDRNLAGCSPWGRTESDTTE